MKKVASRRAVQGDPDQDLVDMLRQDSSSKSFDAAIRQFNERHGQQLRGAVRRVVPDEDHVDDALQETWLKVFQGFPNYRGESSFRTWVTSIALNCGRSIGRIEVRSVGGRGMGGDVGQMQSPSLLNLQAPDESEEPDIRAFREIYEFLDRKLDPQFGLPLIMHMSDFGYREIADTLSLAEGTVKSRIHMARKRIAQEFGIDPSRLGEMNKKESQVLGLWARGTPRQETCEILEITPEAYTTALGNAKKKVGITKQGE